MIKEADNYANNSLSIIFDATNATKEKRKEYIDYAFSKGLPIRCINLQTDITESLFRNNKRNKVIPKITYYVFRKKYVQPTIDEGFYEIVFI